MLEGVELLTLKTLNDVTVAWTERDYHRRVFRELNITPLKRLIDGDVASRPGSSAMNSGRWSASP